MVMRNNIELAGDIARATRNMENLFLSITALFAPSAALPKPSSTNHTMVTMKSNLSNGVDSVSNGVGSVLPTSVGQWSH